jgi:multiple sugar transport system ATP-binding protein
VKKNAGILGIYDLLERKPDTLSGGQQQRVALGRAMVMEPAVFLMDEPLSNLDAGLRETMRLELIRLHKEINKTFIYVTHDQREALTMGQRVVILNEGRIQQVDSPERIYTFPENTFVGGFIGRPAMNFFNGSVGKNDEGINVVLKDGQRLKIPRYRGDVLDQSGYVNQDVVVGIRPEHMHFDTNPGKKCSDLKITVVNNEIVGPRSNLYFMMDQEIKTVETQQYCDYTPGTDVTLKVEEQRIRVFDRQSGSRII